MLQEMIKEIIILIIIIYQTCYF